MHVGVQDGVWQTDKGEFARGKVSFNKLPAGMVKSFLSPFAEPSRSASELLSEALVSATSLLIWLTDSLLGTSLLQQV